MSGDTHTNRFEADRLYVAIGNRITAEREAQNLTQSDIARMAKLSHSTIAHAENGRTCSVLVLAKIAEALDVLIDELVPLDATNPTTE